MGGFDRMVPVSVREINFVKAGVEQEQARILDIVCAGEWSGLSLQEDIDNLVALIKGKAK